MITIVCLVSKNYSKTIWLTGNTGSFSTPVFQIMARFVPAAQVTNWLPEGDTATCKTELGPARIMWFLKLVKAFQTMIRLSAPPVTIWPLATLPSPTRQHSASSRALPAASRPSPTSQPMTPASERNGSWEGELRRSVWVGKTFKTTKHWRNTFETFSKTKWQRGW